MSGHDASGTGGTFPPKIAAGIAATISIFAALAYQQAGGEPSALYAICLLGLPVVVCVVLAVRYGGSPGLLNPLLALTLGLVVFQAVVLLFYTFRSHFEAWIYAWLAPLALVVAMASVVASLWLASMMLSPGANGTEPVSSHRLRLVRSLRRHPTGAICFFVSVFCLVTVFLAFGLAFHDQGLRLAASEKGEATDALPRVLASGPPVGLFAGPIGPKPPAPRAESPEVGSEGSPLAKTWKVRFPRGETRVACGPNYQGLSEGYIAELEGEEWIAATNERELGRLAAHIASRNGHSRLQVVIAGHADDTSPTSGQGTNFEISRARADQVWLEILHRLQGEEHGWSQDVQWYPMAFSNQGPFLDPSLDPRPGSVDRLLVEVAVLPSSELIPEPIAPAVGGRPLELLDYLYFTVYTITTTGYGDIVPVSPYAKLTTALANLSEVLFMVIFFNVLVAFLRARTASPSAGAP